jgi:hypothetical protein
VCITESAAGNPFGAEGTLHSEVRVDLKRERKSTCKWMRKFGVIREEVFLIFQLCRDPFVGSFQAVTQSPPNLSESTTKKTTQHFFLLPWTVSFISCFQWIK